MPFGTLSEFSLEEGKNWSAYIRLVNQFILLNDIKPELQVATLVTHVGAQTYQLMCDLCSPDYPEEKSFDQLIELVAGHLEPKRSEIAERHTFRHLSACQNEGESVGVFLQSLKHLATHCNFGTTLEVNIRDQFVSGLRSEEVRSRLFAEASLDYRKAVELALALEAAGSTAALSASPGPLGLNTSALHRVAPRTGAGAARAVSRHCWRCGKGAHAPNKFKYKSYVCDKCNEKGHLSAVCNKDNGSSSCVHLPSTTSMHHPKVGWKIMPIGNKSAYVPRYMKHLNK